MFLEVTNTINCVRYVRINTQSSLQNFFNNPKKFIFSRIIEDQYLLSQILEMRNISVSSQRRNDK